MKFTLNWLKEYVDVDCTADVLTDRLTMLGLEVDSVTDLYGDLAGVRVARIDRVESHPHADRLSICEVTVDNATVRVVCGAPNARVGMYTAFVPPGITLPSGMSVKEATIRGEVSKGMLCSEKDLGISEDHRGIMEISGEFFESNSLLEALDLQDTLIEVDLTPNRPDCTCLAGIAREVAGFSGSPLTLPCAGALPELTGTDSFVVEVLNTEACPRYAARLLRNVKVGPSPWWLRKRLLAIGQRPINNIVDVTNLVMMELGQPLHAFDFKQLAGGKIVVRNAVEGEKTVTLDGVERDLDTEMLLICDAEKAVAVAGVMGGENSEVREETVDVLLESAYFNPISIRRTARKLKLGTEASYRFERGIDPEGVVRALDRAARLIAEITGAEIVAGGIDCRVEMAPVPVIELRVSRTCDLIGIYLGSDEIAAMLNSIEISTERKDDNVLLVRPPSFRVDLEREVDLIEEVARIKGFNEIPSTLPDVPMSLASVDENRLLRKRVAGIMTSLGCTEVINYSFVSAEHFDLLGLSENNPARNTVRLLNPLSEEQSVMRTMLLPGILENVKRNINRQSIDLRLFEVGKVFLPVQGQELPEERTMMFAVFGGRRHPSASAFHHGSEQVDIYDVKGVAEVLIQELRLSSMVISPASEDTVPPFARKGSWAVLKNNDSIIGGFGQIDKKVLKAFGIKQDLYFLEISINAALAVPQVKKSFSSLPRFPSVAWDIALLVSDQVAAGEMLTAIAAMHEPLVEKTEIFDVYQGDKIDQGVKSVAISITYRSDEKTLDDETVDAVHQKIIQLLETRFEGRLREAQ